MTTQDVIVAFAKMTGASIAQATEESKLADLAIAVVTENLRDPLMIDQDGILVNVCAATMNYWYQLAQGASQPAGSFEGDGLRVQVESEETIQKARKLRDEWWAAAQEYLKDNGSFYFARTEGVGSCKSI